jgi:hypothetical protein
MTNANGEEYLLDLFSTSQTSIKKPPKCYKNAPYICIPGEYGSASLFQGCCNDWQCPRCGELRAKHEYGRIVEGARKLSKLTQLYMTTVTCRGDVTLEKSEAEYLTWTNRLNTNVATYSRRELGSKPEYAAVIERQKRGHFHTHSLTSFCPPDAYFITDEYERYCLDVEVLNAEIPEQMRFSPDPLKDIDNRQMFSTWLSLAAVNAGLGVQVRIAICDVIEGASRYIAKYLFKTLRVTKFPRNLRRVRYSRGWPKLPKPEATTGFVILKAAHWQRVAKLNRPVECWGVDVFDRAVRAGVYSAYFKNVDGDIVDVSDRQTVN